MANAALEPPATPQRELAGLTAQAEKRLLVWIAGRLPASVNPDHLTALGLLGMAGAGASYALSARDPRWLHAVNLFLVVNWLGDSLDGTLARVRKRLRPRYGFYVDHLSDALGALFLLATSTWPLARWVCTRSPTAPSAAPSCACC
jgi:archaetidylinositol phosphate synthase